MPETAPFPQDIVTSIVNVQWLGWLAVIFGAQADDAPKQTNEPA